MDISTYRHAEGNGSASARKNLPLFCTITSLGLKCSLLSFCIAGLLTAGLFLFPFMNRQPTAHALSNGVAVTPPMGWSSWNAHFANINASVIEAAADAMANSGMKAAGYQYVNTDEGWWTGSRDASGNITVNTANWPGGCRRWHLTFTAKVSRPESTLMLE